MCGYISAFLGGKEAKLCMVLHLFIVQNSLKSDYMAKKNVHLQVRQGTVAAVTQQ